MAGIRRTWDKAVYEAKAKERQEKGDAVEEKPSRNVSSDKSEFKRAEQSADGPVGSERAFLKPREAAVDLDSRVGKVEIIKPNTTEHDKGPGFFCEVCGSLHKDSVSYLDHINGKKHQRALGFSMRVERANVDQVVDRLELLKRKVSTTAALESSRNASEDYETKMALQVAEEEKAKRQRKEDAAARRREREAADMEGADPEFASLMGFGGFATKKR